MRVLGIDLETTGLDFDKDRVIEIGLVLYDTDLKIPLKMFSEFVNEPNRPKIDPSKVPALITNSIITEFGWNPSDIITNPSDITTDPWLEIIDLFTSADYIVAHNGNKFDKLMFQNFCARYDIKFPDLPWLDTMTDIEYPHHCAARNLVYLAGYHGFVNPFPHRALFDVMTMFKIMSCYSIDAMIERHASPMVTLQALVEYANKDLAKAEKFMWDGTKRIWYKEIKECDMSDEWLEGLQFEIKVLS